MKKRFLSAVMALALSLALLPVTALADGKAAAIGTKEYDTLAAALADVPKDKTATTIKVLKDFTAGSFEIPSNTNITLDLNGCTLDLGSGRYGIELQSDSIFTLADSKGGGILKFNGTSGTNRTAIYSSNSSPTINIQGGTVEMTSTADTSFYAVRSLG